MLDAAPLPRKLPALALRSLFALALLASTATLRPALSATTAAVAVSVDVVSPCALGTGPLVFPAYPGRGTTASSTLLKDCEDAARPEVAVGTGNAAAALTHLRYMTSNKDRIAYDLSAGTPEAKGLGVYGRVLPGQHAAAGTYSDDVVVTVEL